MCPSTLGRKADFVYEYVCKHNFSLLTKTNNKLKFYAPIQGKVDQYTYFASERRPTLNYTICTSSNMKTLHLALSDKSLWDGLKKSDSETINALLTEPVWQIAPKEKQLLTESAVVNYTEDVIALGYFRQGKSVIYSVPYPKYV